MYNDQRLIFIEGKSINLSKQSIASSVKIMIMISVSCVPVRILYTNENDAR